LLAAPGLAAPQRTGSTLHHAVPTQSRFRFAAIRWSDACRNALLAGARTVQRLSRRPNARPALSASIGWRHPLLRRRPGAKRVWESSAVPVSGMAVVPQRRSPLAINGLAAGRSRTVISAVFHNASLNAHIEWRFP